MTVLFLSAASSIHTVRWVNSLAERGFKIILVSLKQHKDSNNLVSPNVKIYYLPFNGFKGYYLNCFMLRKILILESVDLLNVHYASGYGTLARLSKFHPCLLSVWGSDVYDFPHRNCFNYQITKKNIEFADKIASTSKCMAIKTRELTSENLDISITPFGVDIDLFKPIKSTRKDSFTFATIKIIDDKYGIDFIIRSFFEFYRKLEDKSIKIQYLIYGDGPKFKEYQKLIFDLNMGNHILLKGYVRNEEIPEILSQVDVYLLGSKQESFGVSAVEAMSCGVPVIATKADGFKEVISDSECGYIIEYGDIQSYSKRMTDLYKDKSLRIRIGENARARVIENYDFENNVTTMSNIYYSFKKGEIEDEY
ncbi:MAG: glycosyltransferase [Bacilli bacterium]